MEEALKGGKTRASKPKGEAKGEIDAKSKQKPKKEALQEPPHMSEKELEGCADLLSKLKNSSSAGPFLFPGDSLISSPGYSAARKKIKNPMDLTTISQNLENKRYRSREEVVEDIELVFKNCFEHNDPSTQLYKTGVALENYYKQITGASGRGADEDKKRKSEGDAENKKIKERSMSEEDHEKCLESLNEMVKARHRRINWPFLEPVDAELIPSYYKLITHPMDLSTIRKKLAGNEYRGPGEFSADFELMINNCYRFNPPGSEVYACATKLNALFKQVFEQKRKKPAGEDANEKIAELRSLVAQQEQEIRRLEKRLGMDGADFGYEEKRRLKKRIEGLSTDKLRVLVSYLQNNVPSVVVNGSEELEVNLDLLDQSVLNKINEITQETAVEEKEVESDSSSE